jgi:hypothetical protein
MTHDAYQEPTEPTVEELELEYLRQERSRLSAECDSLRAALVEAQEIGERKDDIIRRVQKHLIRGYYRGNNEAVDDLTSALALTQTPNLYRELTERIKENERMARQIKVLVKASETVAGNPECPEQFSTALYSSVKDAVAIGRKGGE